MKLSLNEALPSDIRILDVIQIKSKAPSSMAAVAFAKYTIRFQVKNNEINAEEIIDNILPKSEIMKMKRTKAGEKLVDIRPLIQNIVLEANDEHSITFEAIVKAGSNGSLGVDMLVKLLIEASNEKLEGYPFVRRAEIYALQDDKKISLLRYFTGK
jgi:radical SAM-linked protein